MKIEECRQWLTDWDSNIPIHTVEMGGLGPGYEQCIQIMAAEFLRSLVTRAPDPEKWSDKNQWELDKANIQGDASETIDRLGPSGAQFGAAISLATSFYRRGPNTCVQEVEQGRRIMVQKEFPR